MIVHNRINNSLLYSFDKVRDFQKLSEVKPKPIVPRLHPDFPALSAVYSYLVHDLLYSPDGHWFLSLGIGI